MSDKTKNEYIDDLIYIYKGLSVLELNKWYNTSGNEYISVEDTINYKNKIAIALIEILSDCNHRYDDDIKFLIFPEEEVVEDK